MRILEMILPRLETMAELAADRSVVRDPISMAELREDYRYMANVCMSLLPDLEPGLAELPLPCDADAAIELKVAYQMSLIRQTNRLHRAVNATLVARQAIRQERRRRASVRQLDSVGGGRVRPQRRQGYDGTGSWFSGGMPTGTIAGSSNG